MKEFVNFKMYDKKGRKLAIFATVKEDNLEFFVMTCSKQDVFSKDYARLIYKKFKDNDSNLDNVKPYTYEVKIEDINHTRNAFLKECDKSFCRGYEANKIVIVRRKLFMTKNVAEDYFNKQLNKIMNDKG